jgi:hypothetical protein
MSSNTLDLYDRVRLFDASTGGGSLVRKDSLWIIILCDLEQSHL